jgi:hypothetical protein
VTASVLPEVTVEPPPYALTERGVSPTINVRLRRLSVEILRRIFFKSLVRT